MMRSEPIHLCALTDIPDPGSREFSWGGGPWPLEFFVIRVGETVFGYENHCPHAGHPLNWQPHVFLTPEDDLILCNSHGARFRITDGICVAGPCPGARLEPVPLQVRDGKILMSAEGAAAATGRTQC